MSEQHLDNPGSANKMQQSPSSGDLSSDKTDPDNDSQKALSDPEKEAGNDTTDDDSNIVDFDGPDDPLNPYNWPNSKKWLYATLLGGMTLVVTFASSVFSTTVEVTSVEFQVSSIVMTLGTALFVLGFAFGPLVWGPMSELYGRRNPLFIGYFIFAIFQVPVAVAQNLQTIFVCRFFGGVFASTPLAIVGGYLADFFGPVHRGLAVCVFSAATFVGPIAGPVVGGFITESYLGWRWTAWITLIMAALFGGIAFIVLPESYAPVILKQKAVRLRLETKNWALHAKSEESAVGLKAIFEKYLQRPFKMMFMEPILVLITIYMSLIYGLLYLFFEAYPITFQEERGYSPGIGGLPFLAIGIGIGIGAAIITQTTLTRFKRKFEEFGHVVPEERLIPMIIGGILLPIGLFWFAWTSDPNITPWPQIVAGIPVGAGIQMIFLQGLNYIIDVYVTNSASALTANTFARSWVGAGFIMFATGMYDNLGVAWATSLLAFLAVALFPVPVLFFLYGHKIRALSKYGSS